MTELCPDCQQPFSEKPTVCPCCGKVLKRECCVCEKTELLSAEWYQSQKTGNIVSDVVITDEHAADSPQFSTLVKNTADHFLIDEVSADPAYSSRKNHDLVEKLGGKPFILFKSNATGRSVGSSAWHRAYHYFQLHKDEFLEHYHKRSNVETAFSSIKMKFGETLKSRNHTAQVNEMLCKIISYNLTVLIRELIEMGADPNLL
jgi:hypothetical protein